LPLDGTSHWTGMIGRLAKKQIDISIAGLTVQADRQESIDFTMPVVDVKETIFIPFHQALHI